MASRRQVFVESDNDVSFFDEVYQTLRARLGSVVSLTFISAGIAGPGGSAAVRAVVNQLRTAGNLRVFGVIDWDGVNGGSEGVLVLAHERRYSIESCLLDPLLVGAYLLRERHVLPEDVGLSAGANYTRLLDIRGDGLARLASFVAERVLRTGNEGNATGRTSFRQGDVVYVEYVGGAQLSVPREYVLMQGHDLEARIQTTFTPLQRFQREGDLKRDIIKKVLRDYPDFVPRDLYDVISELLIRPIV